MADIDVTFVATGEEFLEHYGKQGMKWGHKSSSSTSTSKSSKTNSDGYPTTAERVKAGAKFALLIGGITAVRVLAANSRAKVVQGKDFVTDPNWLDNYMV